MRSFEASLYKLAALRAAPLKKFLEVTWRSGRRPMAFRLILPDNLALLKITYNNYNFLK